LYCEVEVDRNSFVKFWPKPKVYLCHGTENETETETEYTDLAETETSDFIVKISP